jgi:phage terminase small subunit
VAIFRKIHVTFWSDTFTSELSNDRKLFYLYLLTNERTKQCGIYEISKRQISFDLGCSIDTVSKHLQYFIKIGKIQYSDTTNEVAIKNWKKFNYSTSPKVVKCIESELKEIKNKVLIEYISSIDTVSQEEEEEEEEEEQEEEQEKIPTVNWEGLLNQFNEITGKKAKVVDDKTKKQFLARLKDGYTKNDIVNAITNCYNSEFHKSNGHKNLTLEFISRPDKFAMYFDFKETIVKPQIKNDRL